MAFTAGGDGLPECGNRKQSPPLSLAIGSDPWRPGLHVRQQHPPRDRGTGELHQPMVCLLVLADGRGFNKRPASYQAATPYKNRHSNGQRYSEPLVAL